MNKLKLFSVEIEIKFECKECVFEYEIEAKSDKEAEKAAIDRYLSIYELYITTK